MRQSAGGADDPFTSVQLEKQEPDQGEHSHHWSINAEEANGFSANESPYRPREDRAGVQLSGDNAQAVLPPNACVFVAKWVAITHSKVILTMFAASYLQRRTSSWSTLLPRPSRFSEIAM